MAIDAAALQRRLAAAYEGELEIIGLLGTGGFAAVFQAHDPMLQRDVAIKVIDPAAAPHADNQDVFMREARVVATVEHPHIVPLYAAEVRDGLLCLTMRLVSGRSLAERIKSEGALAPAEAARLANEVADALAAAHARGVVHRDIKPENILLDGSGHAIVTDFGISLVTGRANERRPGMVIGTPAYLSPEQALGEDLDGRSDVYSLGVVMYEMLAGRVPFDANTTGGLLAQQIMATPPPLSSLRPDLPEKLVAVTNRALAKSPNERPAAAELAAELALARVPSAMVSPRVMRSRRRWRRVRWTVIAIVLLALALGLAAFAVIQTLTTFTGGRPPMLSALGSSIPAALIAAARADGSLLPDDLPEYAFVPGNRSWSDAMFFTDRAIIRRTPTGSRRHSAWRGTTTLTVFRRGSLRGFVIIDPAIGRPDTLYANLSGAELGALFSVVMEHPDARTDQSADTKSPPTTRSPRPQ